ncbi:MAG: thymidine kinase [Candidatus Buchananbacteria bacterium]
MYKDPNRGGLLVYTGSMFSGKTSYLIRDLLDAEKANGLKVQCFKPNRDTRIKGGKIASLDGSCFPAEIVPAKCPQRILKKIKFGTKVVGIDEAQFFSNKLVDVVLALAKTGIRVIIAGLDTNFKREAFGPMGNLLGAAQEVVKLPGKCEKCEIEGHMLTQRLNRGKPSSRKEPTIIVGGKKEKDGYTYEARCVRCHCLAEDNQKKPIPEYGTLHQKVPKSPKKRIKK